MRIAAEPGDVALLVVPMVVLAPVLANVWLLYRPSIGATLLALALCAGVLFACILLLVRRASRLYALGIPWALLGMALPAVTLVIASAGVVGR